MRDTMANELICSCSFLPKLSYSKSGISMMWNSKMIKPYFQKNLLCGVAVFGLLAVGGANIAIAQDDGGIPSPTPMGAIETVDEVLQEEPSAQNLLPEEEGVDAPDNTALEVPEGEIPGGEITAGTGGPSDAGSAEAESGITDEDVFYDAQALVPEGELGKRSHRALDPRTEPASRMILVRKNATGNSRQARLVSAERALKLGRESSALEIYNELYKKNKRDKQVLMGRAVALQKLGLTEEAIFAYEELLELEPGHVEARANMLGLMASKYPAVALRQLKDLRANNPDNVALVAQLGIAEAQLGNLDSAIRYIGVAASMEPNNASHLYNMAIMADQAGAKKEAIRYYEQALEVDSIYGGGRSIPRDAVYSRLAKLR